MDAEKKKSNKRRDKVVEEALDPGSERLDDSETKLKSKKKKRLDDSETILKSRKIHKCSKEIKKPVEKDLKKIQTDPDLPTKERETPKKEFECCFAVPEAEGDNWGNNIESFLVEGFDSNLPRDCIKAALEEHFGSCGEITRVFVPVDCETGARLGYAFINLEDKNDIKKALALNGSDLGGRKLEVVMAEDRDEFYCYPFPNSKGCSTCRIREHRMRIYWIYNATAGGRMMSRDFLRYRPNPFGRQQNRSFD